MTLTLRRLLRVPHLIVGSTQVIEFAAIFVIFFGCYFSNALYFKRITTKCSCFSENSVECIVSAVRFESPKRSASF